LNTYLEDALEGIEDADSEEARKVETSDVVTESVSGVARVKEFDSAQNTPPWIDEVDSIVLNKPVLSSVIVTVKSSSVVVVNSLVVVK
jgi:hypothetical protein